MAFVLNKKLQVIVVTAAVFVFAASCPPGLFAAPSKDGRLSKLTVVAEPANAGRTEGSGEFVIGSVVEIQAFPREGFVFSGWHGPVTNPNDPVTRTYLGSEAQQITALFEPVKHLLTANIVPAGAGSVEGSGYRPSGTMPAITAIPAPGFMFDRWEGPVARLDDPVTSLKISLAAPITITAYFKPAGQSHTLTVAADPLNGGKVTKGGRYEKGAIVELTAEPATGFLFAGWEGQVDSPARARTKLLVSGDMRVTARFKIDRGMVDGLASPANGGRVTGELRARPVGIPALIVAEPAPGFRFVRWEGPVSDRTSARTTITPVHAKIVAATAIFEPLR